MLKAVDGESGEPKAPISLPYLQQTTESAMCPGILLTPFEERDTMALEAARINRLHVLLSRYNLL
jgi:hypothetical protein